MKQDEKMWQIDIIIEIQVEPLIIHLGSNSSSSSDSESGENIILLNVKYVRLTFDSPSYASILCEYI